MSGDTRPEPSAPLFRDRYSVEESRRGAWHLLYDGRSTGLAFDTKGLADLVADALAHARTEEADRV